MSIEAIRSAFMAAGNGILRLTHAGLAYQDSHQVLTFAGWHLRADSGHQARHQVVRSVWSRWANSGRVATPLPEGLGVAGQEAIVQGLADSARPG